MLPCSPLNSESISIGGYLGGGLFCLDFFTVSSSPPPIPSPAPVTFDYLFFIHWIKKYYSSNPSLREPRCTVTSIACPFGICFVTVGCSGCFITSVEPRTRKLFRISSTGHMSYPNVKKLSILVIMPSVQSL